MICRTKRSDCAPRTASTRFKPAELALLLWIVLALGPWAQAQEGINPEVARMLARAVQEAEELRQQLPTLQYEATMHVQEWDGRGRLRGTAKAKAIMRPGAEKPMTFISREMQGKVRLPQEDKRQKKKEKDNTTLEEFAREHQIADRFEFTLGPTERVAGGDARQVRFQPKPNFPAKDRSDRFLNAVSGTAWLSEETNKLVKFEMRLLRPFQLFWILAVLKELKIEYELLAPAEIIGRSKMKVLFALTTPVYSIRQLHDVELDNFRRRDTLAAAN